MRTLKLQVQMTVDGYIAGSNGEMDWTIRDWDDALKRYVTDLTCGIVVLTYVPIRTKHTHLNRPV